jgi:2-methylisocitrate lyase-like PEP mutase family enzyme
MQPDPAARAALAARAARFRELHAGPPILILPNAWDAASARLFEAAGFPALGTTSAGIAASLGYPDGQFIPADEMLQAIARIVRAATIPVSADVEAGYQDPTATAAAVIAAGAVGINLEDARGGELLDAGQAVEHIRAVRRVCGEIGVPLVINARTDVFLLGAGPPQSRFGEAVRRANLYRDAGADCLFVPAVRDAETIGSLARAIRGPLNILAAPGVPPAPELERLGVARVSTGSGPMRAALTAARRVAAELRERGSYSSFTGDVIPYAEVNRLMGR